MRAPCSDGGILEDGAQHLDGCRLRGSSVLEDLALVGLVVVDRRRCLAVPASICGRDDALRRRDLRDHRLEPREEQRRDVELAVALKRRQHVLRDRLGIDEADLLEVAQIDDTR